MERDAQPSRAQRRRSQRKAAAKGRSNDTSRLVVSAMGEALVLLEKRLEYVVWLTEDMSAQLYKLEHFLWGTPLDQSQCPGGAAEDQAAGEFGAVSSCLLATPPVLTEAFEISIFDALCTRT